MPAANTRNLLEQLETVVAQVCDVYRNLPDPDVMVYELWSAKDILAHITFWHESFARNASDLAAGVKPTPLVGTYPALNQGGVDAMKSCTLDAVIERLQHAQAMIRDSILDPRVVAIPYRKGSRDYSPAEHLQIVIDHIGRHLRDVVRKARRRS
ncbi:MAG: DinB family protein [Chloroflexi bacterium]|nr:DinB family protein [Chloroflexota bacterium]